MQMYRYFIRHQSYLIGHFFCFELGHLLYYFSHLGETSFKLIVPIEFEFFLFLKSDSILFDLDIFLSDKIQNEIDK